MSSQNKEIFSVYRESVAGIQDTAQTPDSYAYAPANYREDEEQAAPAPPVDNEILRLIISVSQDAMKQKGDERINTLKKLKNLVSSLQ